jgi:acetoin utilization protein AcuB
MFIHYSMTPEPITIPPDMLVTEAAELLKKQNFRHLPVVDKDNKLLGMVTDRDLRSACPSTVLSGNERAHVLKQVQATPVRTIMSKDFSSLQAAATLDDALLLFKSRSIGALPVVNSNGQVVGIFSLNDLMSSYRRLFGLGEKGSVLMAIEDNDNPLALSRLVSVLEENKVFFTRLIRTEGQGKEPAMLYLRINTMNIRSVHKIVEGAGFTIHIPVVDA